MGEHKDNEKDLDQSVPISSVSFGASRAFHLRHDSHRKGDKTIPVVKITLTDGLLLLMNPPTNDHWFHSVPQRKSCHEPRINLTFRKIIKARWTLKQVLHGLFCCMDSQRSCLCSLCFETKPALTMLNQPCYHIWANPEDKARRNKPVLPFVRPSMTQILVTNKQPIPMRFYLVQSVWFRHFFPCQFQIQPDFLFWHESPTVHWDFFSNRNPSEARSTVWRPIVNKKLFQHHGHVRTSRF